MVVSRHHAVDSASEASDFAAVGYLLHDLKQLWVIYKKKQQVQNEVVRHHEIHADAFVNFSIKSDLIEPTLNELKKPRLQETWQLDTVFSVETATQGFQVYYRPGKNSLHSCELYHPF